MKLNKGEKMDDKEFEEYIEDWVIENSSKLDQLFTYDNIKTEDIKLIKEHLDDCPQNVKDVFNNLCDKIVTLSDKYNYLENQILGIKTFVSLMDAQLSKKKFNGPAWMESADNLDNMIKRIKVIGGESMAKMVNNILKPLSNLK